MGMFDYVRCKLPMAVGQEPVTSTFQTKSLWRGLDEFTINEAGRLIFHRHRYSFTGGAERPVAEHVGDIDMEYHGDLELYGTMRDGQDVCYVIRFTHGVVEWIRALEELSEMHQRWIEDRGI